MQLKPQTSIGSLTHRYLNDCDSRGHLWSRWLVGIETYGKATYDWLKTFLALPQGIPSHDTFGRVFARLDPEQLQQCFLRGVRSVSCLTAGEVIAIDGKTARRSYNQGQAKGAIHMVSA